MIGVACRFPRRGEPLGLLAPSGIRRSAVTHGSPGDTEGRVGEMFPDDVPVHDASRYGAFLSGIDRFDAEVLPDLAARGGVAGPAAAAAARDEAGEALEDAGVDPDRLVGSRSGVYVGIGSYEYQEIVRGRERGDRIRHAPLPRHRQPLQHSERAELLRAGPGGALDRGGHRLLFVGWSRCTTRCGPAARRGRPGARGRRVRDSLSADDGSVRQCGDAVADRTVLDVRRTGGRLRAERRLRDAGSQAPRRSGGGRRPHLGGDSRHGV